MAQRSENTMAESLQKMLGDVADMKVLPDADLEFLIHLETVILQKLRAPIDDIMGQGQGRNTVPGSMGMGQQPGAMPMGPGGGVPGLRTEPSMPNMEEFTRSLGGVR